MTTSIREHVPSKEQKKTTAPRCNQCGNVVAKNHKRCLCVNCFDFTHARCAKLTDVKSITSTNPKEWTCSKCIGSVLPFYASSISSPGKDNSTTNDIASPQDQHHQALADRMSQLKIMHINTQSMLSTFDNLMITLNNYPFDIITMSETWLKDNQLLLHHVSIPGYNLAFRKRETRGGGVGIYVQ